MYFKYGFIFFYFFWKKVKCGLKSQRNYNFGTEGVRNKPLIQIKIIKTYRPLYLVYMSPT